MIQNFKRTVDFLAIVIVLAMTYFITGKLGLLLAIPPGYVTPIWPPSGIALAAILFFGYKVWPGIILGAVLLNTDITVFSYDVESLLIGLFKGIGSGVGPTLQTLAAAYLVKRFTDYPDCFSETRQILTFLLLGGALASVIGASFGAFLLYGFDFIEQGQVVYTWMTWWMGDVMGVVVFAPLTLIFFKAIKLNKRQTVQVATVLAMAFMSVVLMFTYSGYIENKDLTRELFLACGFFFVSTIGIVTLVLSGKNAWFEKVLKEQTKDLEKTKEFLSQTNEMANVGGWEYNLKTNEFTWTEQSFRIHGHPLSSKLTPELAMSFCTEEAKSALTAAIKNAVEHGGGWDLDHDIVTGAGESRRVRTNCHVDSENGVPVRLYGSIQDITRQYHADEEKEKLLIQLQQAHKMEAVGQLAGGISHEFNNMLQVILGYAHIAMDEYGMNQAGHLTQYLGQIQEAGERAKELVGQILAFSRANLSSSVKLNPVVVVEQAITMLKPTMPSTIKIDFDCDESIPNIQADKTQLNQIVVNLCINARDAMSGKGSLAIKVSHISKQKKSCASCHETFSGDFVEISVRDSGQGMSADVKNKIFEPFFTTKEVGSGTGMGLAVVHGIVHEYGGHIEIESNINEGTEFKILFPAACEHRTGLETEEPLEKLTINRKASVLLIDDEKMLVDLLESALLKSGHTVHAFTDPMAALGYYQIHRDEIDIVITDQTMPTVTGLELAKSIMAMNKSQQIILYTGYSDSVDEDIARNIGIRSFLTKPVCVSDLLKCMDDMLLEVNEKENILRAVN